MTDFVQQRDPAATSLGFNCAAHTSVVAGGSGNNVQVTGLTIDRVANGTPLTAIFSLLFEAVLGAGNTLSIAAFKVEHSPDGATWSTYAPPAGAPAAPGIVATGPGGGGTVRGRSGIEVSVSSAYRYVRFDFTPVMSAANTDTAVMMASVGLHGFGHLPPP